MTDRELFEKIEKNFNLKKTKYLNEKFNGGNFIKLYNEVLEPTAPNLGIRDTFSSLFGSGKVKRDALRRTQAQRLGKGFDDDGSKDDKKSGEAQKFQQFLNQPGNESYRTVYNKVKKSGKIAEQVLTAEELEIYNKISTEFKKFKTATGGKPSTRSISAKDKELAAVKKQINILSQEFGPKFIPLLSQFKVTDDFARTVLASKIGKVHTKKSEHFPNTKQGRDEMYNKIKDVIVTYLLESEPGMFQNTKEFQKRKLQLDTLVNKGIPNNYRQMIMKELKSRIQGQKDLNLDGERKNLTPEELKKRAEQAAKEREKQSGKPKYNPQNLDDIYEP